MANTTALVSVEGISFDNGDTYSIKRDSSEWQEWFASTPEGSKMRFEWLNAHLHRNSYTAYRRKRYWEAQKRVEGKLRNTTIKPKDCTYQKLEQVGLTLTAYNWDKSKSGKTEEYQTSTSETSQTGEEITRLKAEIEQLRQRESYLLDQLGLVKAQIIHESQEQVKALESRVVELDNANWECEKRLTTYSELHRKSELARQELQSLVAEYQTKAGTPVAIGEAIKLIRRAVTVPNGTNQGERGYQAKSFSKGVEDIRRALTLLEQADKWWEQIR